MEWTSIGINIRFENFIFFYCANNDAHDEIQRIYSWLEMNFKTFIKNWRLAFVHNVCIAFSLDRSLILNNKRIQREKKR